MRNITLHTIHAGALENYTKSNNIIKFLKGPSQPPPFSMPSKLLILHGEGKSECFTIHCVPESTFNYL